MSEGLIVATVTATSVIVSAVLTWALTRKRQQAEARHEAAGAINETVEAVTRVLAVYKAENLELKAAIDELKILNARLEAEVEALKKICAEVHGEG